LITLKALDSRVKLFMLLSLSSVSVISRSVVLLASIFLLTLVLLLLGGVSFGGIFTKTKGALGLICLLFMLQCAFHRQGSSLLTLHGYKIITDLGFHTAVIVTLRLFIILLSALIVLTSEARDYLVAMTQCRLPYELAFMVMIALRFIPMLREEAQDVLCAVQMRGIRLKKAPLRRKISTYTSVMLPIVSGAIHRAEQTSIAMEARAFRAFPKRTSMRRLKMAKADWIYLAVFTILLILCVVLSEML
jgi:energy-coupling factor transport system permease protein